MLKTIQAWLHLSKSTRHKQEASTGSEEPLAKHPSKYFKLNARRMPQAQHKGRHLDWFDRC